MRTPFLVLVLVLSVVLAVSGCGHKIVRERGWIGGRYEDIPGPLRLDPLSGPRRVPPGLPDALGPERSGAALVTAVWENTPAAHAGLREGDLVLFAGGRLIHSASDLYESVETTAPGSSLTLDVFRMGERLELVATIGKERFETWHCLVLGLPLPFWCDLVPNPDFNVFHVLALRTTAARAELRDPRYRLQRSEQHGDSSEEANLSTPPSWALRVGPLTVSAFRRILSQEPARAD